MREETVNYLLAEEIYNQMRLYEGNKNDCPFWALSDNETKYYYWLFGKEEYAEQRASAKRKLGLEDKGQGFVPG